MTAAGNDRKGIHLCIGVDPFLLLARKYPGGDPNRVGGEAPRRYFNAPCFCFRVCRDFGDVGIMQIGAIGVAGDSTRALSSIAPSKCQHQAFGPIALKRAITPADTSSMAKGRTSQSTIHECHLRRRFRDSTDHTNPDWRVHLQSCYERACPSSSSHFCSVFSPTSTGNAQPRPSHATAGGVRTVRRAIGSAAIAAPENTPKPARKPAKTRIASRLHQGCRLTSCYCHRTVAPT